MILFTHGINPKKLVTTRCKHSSVFMNMDSIILSHMDYDNKIRTAIFLPLPFYIIVTD